MLQYLADVDLMVLKVMGVNHDVVKIITHEDVQEISKDTIDEDLEEGAWSGRTASLGIQSENTP